MRINKLKCTFKDKKVQHINDKVTIVTLKGYVPISPELMRIIPLKVHQWMDSLSSVDVSDSCFGLYISTKGKAVRAEEDENNPVLAERVAEARAKMRIYSFLERLCGNICSYYKQLLDIGCYSKKGRIVPNTDLKTLYFHYGTLKDREKRHINELLGHESD